MVATLHAVDGLDPEWLLRLVQPADRTALSALTSLRPERLGEGVGMLTNLHRLHLGYAPAAPKGPATLVLKLPSSIPEVREMARAWGLYQREVMFYRDIASTVAMRVPKAYVTSFDPKTHDFALVLEDISPAAGGDQIIGLSPEQARLALEAAAALHADWWNRRGLARLEATVQCFGEGPWMGSGSRLDAAWPLFKPFLAGRASPKLLHVGERLASAIDRLMVDMARAPRTLCHGDFRADNLMFVERDGGTALVALDWQVALQARGALDVSQLLSTSLSTDLRRAHEAALLRGYHDNLIARGVDEYPYDQFFDDYRRGLLIGFFYVIQPGSAAELSHPRTEALYDTAIRRMDAVVLDHGLETFVD